MAATCPAHGFSFVRRRRVRERRSTMPTARYRSTSPTRSTSRRSTNDGHHCPSRGHSAGFLTFEAVVSYPYHPLAGESVLVVGAHEHDGIHHFLIRQSYGGSYQIPDWMFDP